MTEHIRKVKTETTPRGSNGREGKREELAGEGFLRESGSWVGVIWRVWPKWGTLTWPPSLRASWVQGACCRWELTPGRQWALGPSGGSEGRALRHSGADAPSWVAQVPAEWPCFRGALGLSQTLAEPESLQFLNHQMARGTVFPPSSHHLHCSCYIHFNDGRAEWPFANITHSLGLDWQTVESQLICDPGHSMRWCHSRLGTRRGEGRLQGFNFPLLWQPWDFCCSKRLNATKCSLGRSTNESGQVLIRV